MDRDIVSLLTIHSMPRLWSWGSSENNLQSLWGQQNHSSSQPFLTNLLGFACVDVFGNGVCWTKGSGPVCPSRHCHLRMASVTKQRKCQLIVNCLAVYWLTLTGFWLWVFITAIFLQLSYLLVILAVLFTAYQVSSNNLCVALVNDPIIVFLAGAREQSTISISSRFPLFDSIYASTPLLLAKVYILQWKQTTLGKKLA